MAVIRSISRIAFATVAVHAVANAQQEFSVWLRAYWPDRAILDGTWKPPVIAIAK